MTIAKTQFLYWYGNKKSALLSLEEITRNLKTPQTQSLLRCMQSLLRCMQYKIRVLYKDFVFIPSRNTFPTCKPRSEGKTWGYLPLLQHQVVDWKFHNIKLTKLELVLPSFKNIENKGHGTTIEVTSSEFRLPNALRKKTYLRIFLNDKN